MDAHASVPRECLSARVGGGRCRSATHGRSSFALDPLALSPTGRTARPGDAGCSRAFAPADAPAQPFAVHRYLTSGSFSSLRLPSSNAIAVNPWRS